MERQVSEKGRCFPTPRWQRRSTRGQRSSGLRGSGALWPADKSLGNSLGPRPLSAPSLPRFDHLLTFQVSEPSQPLSSKNLAAFLLLYLFNKHLSITTVL